MDADLMRRGMDNSTFGAMQRESLHANLLRGAWDAGQQYVNNNLQRWSDARGAVLGSGGLRSYINPYMSLLQNGGNSGNPYSGIPQGTAQPQGQQPKMQSNGGFFGSGFGWGDVANMGLQAAQHYGPQIFAGFLGGGQASPGMAGNSTGGQMGSANPNNQWRFY
jgi:hypothetical protein